MSVKLAPMKWLLQPILLCLWAFNRSPTRVPGRTGYPIPVRPGDMAQQQPELVCLPLQAAPAWLQCTVNPRTTPRQPVFWVKCRYNRRRLGAITQGMWLGFSNATKFYGKDSSVLKTTRLPSSCISSLEIHKWQNEVYLETSVLDP